MRRPLVPLLCLTLATAAAAQTFVVDAQNGPGAQFTQITHALANTPDGATLLVRPGQYVPFTVQARSVTILCEPGARAVATLSNPLVEVRDLTQPQQVTIRGLEVGSFLQTGVALTNCAGTVLLDEVEASLGTSFVGGGVSAVSCADVRLQNCFFYWSSGTACALTSSTLTATGCTFGAAFPNGGLFAQTGSVVQLVDCDVGSGGTYAAITLANAELRVAGDSWLTTTALGFGNGGPCIGGNGLARVDPSVWLDSGPSQPFEPGVQVAMIAMPALTAATDPAGGQAQAELGTPPGATGVLFLALPALPSTAVPGLDPAMFLPGSENLRAAGVGTLQAGYAVPPLPLLQGTRVTWQGATLDAVGLQISNAATYVHF